MTRSTRPASVAFFAAVLLVSTGAALSAGPENSDSIRSPDTSKWKVYRNEEYGFQVKYPETWAVHSSKGTPPEMIYFVGPYRGVIGQTLNITIQLNSNPRKLSIEQWFADQLRSADIKKIEAKGCSNIARQPSCFVDHTDESDKLLVRAIYTLLHGTDVLSFEYKLGNEDSPACALIVDSFRGIER